jgi:putative endonuclease
MFFYVYVLESLKDKHHYIGFTNNLKRRLEEHNLGESFATSFRRPFKLIYFEGCVDKEDAERRE